MLKFKIDFARGIAYKGKNGYIIQLSPEGLYIDKLGKVIYLTKSNTKIIEDSYEYGR